MESEFDIALKAAIEKLNIWTKSDALKCQEIYSYITSHVSYDYDAYSGMFSYDSIRRQMSYTAYAALTHEQAVCAGYAQLFYSLAHSVGLHVRILEGEAEGKEGWGPHAWNAVELDGMPTIGMQRNGHPPWGLSADIRTVLFVLMRRSPLNSF